MSEATTAPAGAIDWASMPVTQTATVRGSAKRLEDINETIRGWCASSLESGTGLRVECPDGIAAEVLKRDVKDYALLHSPRLTATVSIPKGQENVVQFAVRPFDQAAADAASAKRKASMAAKAKAEAAGKK
jgi:hypothetical protein